MIWASGTLESIDRLTNASLILVFSVVLLASGHLMDLRCTSTISGIWCFPLQSCQLNNKKERCSRPWILMSTVAFKLLESLTENFSEDICFIWIVCYSKSKGSSWKWEFRFKARNTGTTQIGSLLSIFETCTLQTAKECASINTLKFHSRFHLNGPFTNKSSLSWPDVSLLLGPGANAAAFLCYSGGLTSCFVIVSIGRLVLCLVVSCEPRRHKGACFPVPLRVGQWRSLGTEMQ